MIKFQSPTRIDLAGGTMDIFPLYLLFDGGLTINMAIDLYATIEIEERGDDQITIRSLDQDIVRKFNSIDMLDHNEGLELITRAIQFFQPKTGINVTTNSQVPFGSGLGGSSALLVSLCLALNSVTKKDYSKTEILNIAQGIETQCIRIPTGRQDYIAAMEGGINSIWFDVNAEEVTNLQLSSSFIDKLLNSLLLVYVQPHQSAISNWDMFKQIVDGNSQSLEGMSRIKKTAILMKDALINEDLTEFNNSLQEEWRNRLFLSPKVSTPEMKLLIQKLNKLDKDIAYKAVGSGGGGSMIVSCLDKKDELVKIINTLDYELLDFQVDFIGVTRV
ncbi:MAG: GHMP family kinase ATP-binding protein [Candidatus Kariarchaeaceae archaeon]|jgi:D-glycero-alpha-D-manno-heptose-7-phosphate kinase